MKKIGTFSLCYALLIGTPIMAETTKETLYKESYAYAIKVAKGKSCVFENGYRCADKQSASFPAIYFPYVQVALADFLSIPTLSADEKNLAHYRIEVSEANGEIVVEFGGFLMPKSIVDGKPEGVILASVGKSTKYWIDAATKKINKRLYIR